MLRGIPIGDREILRNFRYFVFAKEFGWTPEQVDSLPKTLADDLFVMILTAKKIEEEEIRKQRSSKTFR